MALSAFDAEGRAPAPGELKKTLGKSAAHWEAIVASVAENHAPIEEEWAFAGAKYGWSLRLKRKGRVVLYLIPQKGGFLAGLVLGEKAAAAALASGLPSKVLGILEAAPRYAEGRGFRVPVATAGDVRSVARLVACKMAK